jgi:hypothetical protein
MIDEDLPFALIDLIVSIVQTVMGAILMCFAAGYFALTIPAIVFVVWGKRYSHKLLVLLLICGSNVSNPKILSTHFPSSSTP